MSGSSLMQFWPRSSCNTAEMVDSEIEGGKPTMMRSIRPSHRSRILAANLSIGATTANVVENLVVDQRTHTVPVAFQRQAVQLGRAALPSRADRAPSCRQVSIRRRRSACGCRRRRRPARTRRRPSRRTADRHLEVAALPTRLAHPAHQRGHGHFFEVALGREGMREKPVGDLAASSRSSPHRPRR